MKKALTLLGAAGLVTCALAAVAWATGSASRQDSAPDPITAEAVGKVAIGDVASAGIFRQELSGLAPGDSFTACVVVRHTGAGEPRVWALGGDGKLAQALDLTISARPSNHDPGHVDCSGDYAPVFGRTLAEFKEQHGTYATGLPWPADGAEFRVVLALPDDADTAELAGAKATLQVAFGDRP